MRRHNRLRAALLAPLMYLAALWLLLEEWLWDVGARMAGVISAWPALKALETRIGKLPPYAALCVFVLPAILLFPVKILALLAIAGGHAVGGVLVIVIAKVAGAAAVARLYLLTRPTLLTLPWFARWHGWFMALKDRWIAALKHSAAYRYARLVAMRLRRLGRAMKARFRLLVPGGRHASYPARVMRRLLATWRARRR